MSNPAVAAGASPSPSLGDRLCVFARDIKVSHTIFAMPWALLATFLAAPNGRPHPGQLGLIVLCMVCVRTVAMAANRLLDAELDAKNPRTARRAIPAGQLSHRFMIGSIVLCSALFIATTAMFRALFGNIWPVALSVPVLAFVSVYPLLKRFTRLCHYYLGAALSLAPLCAWVAVAGGLAPEPLWMAAAVLLWTAGFDVIYACQDYQSDVEHGVFSVPSRLGIGPALWVARLTHVLCVAMLVGLGISSPSLHTLYFVGVGLAVVLLVIEHGLVRPTDLSKVGLAFFTINGIISLLMGVLGILDVFL